MDSLAAAGFTFAGAGCAFTLIERRNSTWVQYAARQSAYIWCKNENMHFERERELVHPAKQSPDK
jgi:hypothetical protein